MANTMSKVIAVSDQTKEHNNLTSYAQLTSFDMKILCI